MTRQTPFIYSLFCGLLIIGISCKRTNEIHPGVVIIEPATSAAYSFGDTINVKAKITNSDGRYELSFRKDLQVFSLSSKLVSSEGNIKSFEIYYDRKDLEEGTYELRLKAYNGENSGSDFAEVYLKEIPLEFLGLALLASNTTSSYLLELDTQLNISQVSLSGDYEFLEYNSFQGRAVIAPHSTGLLAGYSLFPLNQVYKVANNTIPGSALYNDLVDAGQRVYAFGDNGEIKAFGRTGSIDRFFVVQNEWVPISGCYGSEGLLVCVKERGKENYKLELRNAISGAVLKEKKLSGKVVELTNPKEGLYVAVVDKSGQSLLVEYRPETNTLTERYTLQGSPVCMECNDSGGCLISTTSNVSLFTPESGVIPNVVYNFSAKDIAYEPVNGNCYLVSGSKLYRGIGFGGAISIIYQSAYELNGVEPVLSR